MIVRDHPDGHLCIPQSQHAAISGQIAAAWGGRWVAALDPAEAVVAAATHHDDGMDPLDTEPLLDPGTGLPRDFMHLDLETWIECWRRGPAEVAAIDPYAGILVSMHGEHLLGYRRIDPDDEQAHALVNGWRAEQRDLRIRLQTQLTESGVMGPLIDDAQLERNRKLIEIWDAMSLAICMPRLPETFEVPGPEGEVVEVRFEPAGSPEEITVDPWPFVTGDPLELTAEGRVLEGTFPDRESMLRALLSAGPARLTTRILPGGAPN